MSRLWIGTSIIVLAGLGCSSSATAPVPVPAPVPIEEQPQVQIEDPTFRLWSKFPIGTVVVQESITESVGNPNKSITTSTYKLVEKTEKKLITELKTRTVRHDGVIIDNPPDRVTSNRLVTLPKAFAPSQKEAASVPEELTVSGKKYACRKMELKDRNEAGEVLSQTWISDEMPGGLVRSISNTTAVQKRTVIEVTRVEIPESATR
jgi:hypothetical protein